MWNQSLSSDSSITKVACKILNQSQTLISLSVFRSIYDPMFETSFVRVYDVSLERKNSIVHPGLKKQSFDSAR